MTINRRDVLAASSIILAAARPPSAFAQSDASTETPDWASVVEDQQGDEQTPTETIQFSADTVQRILHTRAAFIARLPNFSDSVSAVGNGMVGWSRTSTQAKIVGILDVYGLPFRSQDNKFVPFCAAGISYAVACAYLKRDGKVQSISAVKTVLADIDYYHFYPSPSVWDMYYVARGRRHWVDGKPGINIPKPGWLIIYDWKKNGGADHVGMVRSASPTMLETLEFNTSNADNSNGGAVALRRRPYNHTVKGFIRTDLTTL